MNTSATSLLGGTLFGFGLGVSGVANPVVINRFLDVAGASFSFTLLVLFAAAVVTTTLLYQIVLRLRARPFFDARFHFATNTSVDRRLVWGAIIFGLGWSLSGHCVGPALASSVQGYTVAIPYLIATAVGMRLQDVFERLWWR